MAFDWRPKWSDVIGILGIISVLLWAWWVVSGYPGPMGR
jgi:hypothetical protein